MRLTLRNWLIRGLILAGVAALVGLGWVANSWVSPERVRDQVIASLNEQFDGVDIQIGSAHMRILGGIAVSDLKLSRRGSPSDQAFFVAPSAVLYHDKEQLNRGRLVIKKIELENPELTLVSVMRRIDPSFEKAAASMGAGPWSAFLNERYAFSSGSVFCASVATPWVGTICGFVGSPALTTSFW